MTQPTHTHRANGGRFALVASYNGDMSLDAKMIIVYRDIDREIETATTAKDWEDNWQAVAPDDCPVCLGAGTDQIKGNKDKPCGYCYGLGKVREDGEAPAEIWDVATIATNIIERQKKELGRLRQIESHPDVQALIEQERQQAISDSVARQEQEWRNGRGHGPGGQRHTGD